MCLYFGYKVIYYSLKLSIQILFVDAALNYFKTFLLLDISGFS